MNIARKHLSVREDRTRRSRCHALAVLCLALSLQAIVVLGAGCALTSDGDIGIARGAGTSLCTPLSDAPIDAAPYDDTVFGTVPSYRAPIAGDEQGPHGAPSVTPPATAHAAINWPLSTLAPADGLGKTPGSFAVGDSDGAATYSIPIQVIPGRAGMQPELGILYHSDRGNGLLGVGFSLQGLSSIARCGRTYADDDTLHGVTLTPDDRFCLDGRGHQSTVVRNGRGQVVRAEDARHETTEYRYGPFGSLLRITDARGEALVQVVDAYGRVTEAWNPDSGSRSFVYDAFDQVRSETDNKEQTTLYCHDEVGRPTVRQDVDGLTGWTYDEGPHAVGKLVRTSSPDGVIVQVDYDEAGRPWRETTELPGPAGGSESFAIRRVYNERGELRRVAYPAVDDDAPFAVDYRYDDYGHLTAVEEPSTRRELWRWEEADAANRITRESFGNRVTTARKYVLATGMLEQSTTSRRASSSPFPTVLPLQRLSYGYDGNRNVEHRTDHLQGLTETFEYDELDRLENVYLGDGGMPLYHYEYDDFGNITYKSDVGSYEYEGDRPHAVRHANGKTYEYDENGNQTVRPIDVRGAGNASAAITHTPFDKPRRIEAEHGVTTYEYDGDRQRARKVSPGQLTTYVGGLYERHERTAGGVAHKMHVVGPEGVLAVKTIAIDAAGEETRGEHYLHPGHDGSAGVITNELGAVVERRSYDPFGQRRNPDWEAGGPAAAPPRETIGFTGHEDEEELSLINMRGRIYDPALGRFLSADPFVQAPFFSQSLNRYSYAFNNPLSFVDPTGYQATDEYEYFYAGVTYDNCVVGEGCARIEVGRLTCQASTMIWRRASRSGIASLVLQDWDWISASICPICGRATRSGRDGTRTLRWGRQGAMSSGRRDLSLCGRCRRR
ncbi:RHS repeat-associated core domain-containing protein [Sorangium sp. So ce134]